MSDISGLAVLAVFPLCMILASFYDLFTMTIPNKVTLVLTVAFFVLAPLAGMSMLTMAWHVGLGFGVLVICYALFAIRAMGGGDAKLLAASALWLGPDMTLSYVLLASIFGGVLTFCIIVARRYPLPDMLAGVGWLNRLHDKKTGIPYGLALGPAALLVFPETAWMSFVSSGSFS
ncbi:MAG: A24 family peptidase [Rhizobiaceae bacterium]